MLTDSHSEELFSEPKRSVGPKVVAAALAIAMTALLFAAYAYVRTRHTQKTRPTESALGTTVTERKAPPKAQIFVDDAMLQGGETTIGGTVKNISAEKLEGLSVELELKRRKDGTSEKRSVGLSPPQLEPGQEGRYSLQLRNQEYGSVRFATLKGGPDSGPLPYTVSQGQKRPPERPGSKTITIDKRSSRRDEFLNSPDKPARVP